MIKIKKFACELVDGGASRDESQVFIEVEEALKALEEQAPEVMEEYIDDKLADKEWGEQLCGITKTPWIKVSDQEPPKDGTVFFAKSEPSYGAYPWIVRWMDYTHKNGPSGWMEKRSVKADIFFTHWMPIPK